LWSVPTASAMLSTNADARSFRINADEVLQYFDMFLKHVNAVMCVRSIYVLCTRID
jgi:hypothetical protein